MAGEDEKVEHKGFRTLNNLDPVERLKADELSQAVNVDLDKDGAVRRREGFTEVYSGTDVHSLWAGGEYLLCVEGTQLKRLTVNVDGTLSATAIGSGFMPGRPLAYEHMNGDVYLSNGLVTGLVTGGALIPWGVQTPSRQPALSADSIGGLDAGAYQVAVTFVSSRGEESGSPAPQVIEIPQGGGISLTLLPIPTEANVTTIRIYVSPPNEDVLYLADEVPAGTTSALVYRWDTGMPLETLLLDKMPPGIAISRLGGRLYTALGNVLYWSEPLRYGLYQPARNWMPFPGGDIAAIGAVEGGGLYVVGDKTWFLSGTDPAAFVQAEVLGYGGPKQQMLRVPREAFTGIDIAVADVPVWLSARGFHAGLPGGVVNLTERQAVVDSYQRIAALYRERNGRRQVVATGANPQQSSFAIGDRVIAEVRRNGILIP